MRYLIIFSAAVAVAMAGRRTNTATVELDRWCSQTSLCPADATCCGYGSMQPQCMDATMQCCEWSMAAAVCQLDDVCCGQGGPGASSDAFCCPSNTTCCSSSDGSGDCCSAETEQCCSGVNSFCCGVNEQCCGEVCCGEGLYCDANNLCWQTPAPTPRPANWSAAWNMSLHDPCTRTDFGILCFQPLQKRLGVINPKSGEGVWSIIFGPCIGLQPSTPVQLTRDVWYVAGSAVYVETGFSVALWGPAQADLCTDRVAVFADGPSNVVVTCVRQTTDGQRFLHIFAFFLPNGTLRFHADKNVTGSHNYGVRAVSRHTIVLQHDLEFHALHSTTGGQVWNYTAAANPPAALIVPAADAFVFTSGTSATALRYEDGALLWSHANYLSLQDACQTTARVQVNSSTPDTLEVVVWVGVHRRLMFTESQTGATQFHTAVWTSPDFASCTLATNNKYVWSSSGDNFTAISLTTRQVEWTFETHDFVVTHTGSPTNVDPYVQNSAGNLFRLRNGAIQHKFNLTQRSASFHVFQYDEVGIVVIDALSGLVSFELPP